MLLIIITYFCTKSLLMWYNKFPHLYHVLDTTKSIILEMINYCKTHLSANIKKPCSLYRKATLL